MATSQSPQVLGDALKAVLSYAQSAFGSITHPALNFPYITGLRSASKILAILGTFYGINKLLNSRVVGSRSIKPWNSTKELVLITGGSSGMGAHMVQMFSQKGVRVISLDINPPANALPPNTQFFKVDVTSPEAVHEAAEKIRHEFGDPTVLINNAGIVSGKTILDISTTQLKRMFDVNILAHYWLVKEFLPAMVEKNHGHIVTMASVASFLTISNNVDYSCVKSGLIAFHEGLTQELRNRYNARNVLTSIVFPFWVRTPLIKNLVAHPSFKDGVLEPEEVAEVVVNHVITGGRGTLFVPGYGAALAGIRGFPAWLQELIRDWKASILRETGF